jgi:predicted HTH transcriptional regulator
MDISVRGVEYNLSKLKKMGMLVREGSTKNGNWKIVKSENQA